MCKSSYTLLALYKIPRVLFISLLPFTQAHQNTLHNILNCDLFHQHIANLFLSDEKIKILVLSLGHRTNQYWYCTWNTKKTNLFLLIFTLQLCLRLFLGGYPHF